MREKVCALHVAEGHVKYTRDIIELQRYVFPRHELVDMCEASQKVCLGHVNVNERVGKDLSEKSIHTRHARRVPNARGYEREHRGSGLIQNPVRLFCDIQYSYIDGQPKNDDDGKCAPSKRHDVQRCVAPQHACLHHI